MKIYASLMTSPSGVVCKGDKSKYSDSRDYSIGAPRSNGMVNKDHKTFSEDEAIEHGLTFKEPL